MTALLVAVFVGLCVPRMGEPLWYDELWATRLKVGELPLLLTAAYKDVHPPLHYAGMFLWVQVFGDSEWSIRLPSLLCGIGSILLLAPLGTALVGSGAGRLAAAVLALSPVHVWYATEARPYSLNVLLVILLGLAFERLRAGDPRRRWSWLFWLAACAGPLSHYYLAIPAGVCALLSLRGPRRLRRVAVPAAAAAALLLAAFLLGMSRLSTLRTEMGYLRHFGVHEAFGFLCSWLPTGNAFSVLWPPASWQEPEGLPGKALALAALAGVAWFAIRQAPGRGRLLLQAASLPLFLAAMPLLGMGRSYAERSLLPVLPWLALAAGSLVLLPQAAWARRTGAAALLLLQLGSTLLVLTHPDRATVHLPRADYRSAARWLEADLRGTADVHWALDTRGFSSSRVLGYYSDQIEERAILDTDPGEARRLEARVHSVLAGWPRLRDRVADFARAQFAGLTRWKERRQATNRVLLDRLDPRLSDLALRLRGRPVFYLLCHPEDPTDESSWVPQVLRDARFAVTAREVFRRLVVYRVRFQG